MSFLRVKLSSPGIILFIIYFPGPIRFPLLGTLPQIAAASPTSYLALDKLSKKYGDLMNAKMGMVDAGETFCF